MNIEKEQFYKSFIQREDGFIRAPYNPEIEFYSTIKAGNVQKVKELCKDELVDKPGLGKLSKNPLQNMKYHFVITTALVARYCIQGGLDMSTAYSLSDFYIQKADQLKNVEEISKLHPVMCIDYTKHMRNLRKNTIHSLHVSKCVDYIYDHLHERITVDDLADYVALNPSYLSRLFKKEIGTSISEYIRKQKVETAKNMLTYSELRPAEIALILAFPSQSYFTEIFHKYTGLTPKEYKKQYFHVTLEDEK
ncbi:MAG: AraC family transcriptional regulator [Lachnospiraceae bacterium]|nr:AraC family transcriptional regulator [Lachnospiraceae bacterium]